ncbi:hypothetical protein AEA09_04960 [Lysinibacillus contaminans]|uniref:DUF1835 domain-containing protein n=1 Tax=Lysinibacillus contaminans TaxID=1293441 RepID=A0ABR5JZ83_9BACI|nr:DUF1835 domain-containing protein [Lysinibacillus contaminans]KOS67968.1 hypothetical protein AEA09_04960 [Lysinibacillus contaminans]
MENINRLKQAIKGLSAEDAKSMLFLLLSNSELSEEKMRAMQQSIIKIGEEEQVTKNAQTVHIVFGDSPGGSLSIAMRDTDYELTEEIIVLPDILSVGPVKDLHIEVGIEDRFRWFQERYILEDDGLEHYMHGMLKAVEKVMNISSNQDIVIWTCQNAHEQTGLRLVLAWLKDKLNTVFVLDTFTAFHEIYTYPQLVEECYPKTSGEVTSENLRLFYEQYELRPLQKAKRQALCKEGLLMLANEKNIIRTWEHQELWYNLDESRDDSFIIECAQRMYLEDGKVEYRKSARLIGEVLGHMEQFVGGKWIEYRLRSLIEQGVFSYKGNLKAMRYYEVKLNDEYLTNH